MKILIVGGMGTIGRKVASSLSEKHEVVIAGRSSGTQVDIADTKMIVSMFESIGNVDAIVCIAGETRWAPLQDLSEEDFYTGIRSKLMGQVNLTRIGLNYLNPKGSITLTTGILADDPVLMTTSAAMVNGGVHSFVLAAALEMDGGRRINAVSSGLVEDARKKYQDYFPGHNVIPMDRVINAYARSILGKGNGEIIRVYN